jgi:hypothetical protein
VAVEDGEFMPSFLFNSVPKPKVRDFIFASRQSLASVKLLKLYKETN